MAAHQPAIWINEDNPDCRILEIFDISIYNPDIAVTNPVLKVILPGDTCEYFPIWARGGRSIYTSNTFSITHATCSDGLSNLPDGIYEFTYSVCPNETVFANYKYLRTCQLESLIFMYQSNILNGDCDNAVFNCYGTDVTKSRLQELADLLTYISAAKADVKAGKVTSANKKLAFISKTLETYA